MKKIYYNGRIFTGDTFIEGGSVEVEGSIITAVRDHTPQVDHLDHDLRGQMLVPAFIDIQLYGAEGMLFGEHPSVEALEVTVEDSAAGGSAYILPTVATNSPQVVDAAIEAVRLYWEQGMRGVIGLHLEGPYINPEKRGAHLEQFIKKPSLQDVQELMKKGKGIIKMMTLAPEMCSREVIHYLQQSGVIVSAGHSNASFEQAMQAFDSGIDVATHLFNAMSPMQHRAPGMAGAILHNTNAHASIVADGFHVDFPVISIAKKIMGQRLFLITDAVTDNETGHYRHRLQGDKFVMPDGTLSGSNLSMLKAVKNCVDHAGIPVEEALRMASLYPARVLKLDHVLGQLAEGYGAELLILDDQLQWKGMISASSVAGVAR